MAAVSRKSVELYLQNNPEFVKEWFQKNVPSSTLDEWLDSEADCRSPSGSQIQQALQGHARYDYKTPLKTTKANSITTAMFQNFVDGKRSAPVVRKTRSELLALDERDLFMELIRDIANELDVNVLCHKILLNVCILTKSDRCSLFLVQGHGNMKHLVSKLFDVTEASNMHECLHTDKTEIRVPIGKGIAGVVAQTKETINIKNAYEDPRFNQDVDKQTGYRTKSILCMPILNYEGEVIGVAQIVNKTEGEEEFTPEDEKVFRNYLTFCGIGLTNAQLFEMSVQEYRRNQLLLRLAQVIFKEQAHLEKLVQSIMREAHGLLNCQRCTVYILLDTTDYDREDVIFSEVFEMREDGQGSINTPSMREMHDSRAAKIARDVAKSGKVFNIDDTIDETHEAIVDYDGLKIHNLLSVPILNISGKVIGVVQFVNKTDVNVTSFTESDINTVEAFAIFYGMGIYNCQMYEEACKLMAKQRVALEVLSYHASAPQEDVDKLKVATIPDADHYNLYTFDFNDLAISERDTVYATIRMFLDMGVTKDFHVPYEVLCRWTLSVKKNYRPVIYHNWRHAFNVSQTMFTMFFTGGMAPYMKKLEMFCLVVACLCHDLDHRGTNNAFQAKVESPMALLYSTSTMEHHHFDQCVMILNSEGNNIFKHLPANDYKNAIRIVENAILSTDLALYFKKRSAFLELVDLGEKKWEESYKKELLRGMMMTACDVAAITKPWEIQKEVAHLVASEFFEQGDIERSKLKQEPMAMMDRTKEDELPKMQVGFIDSICLPIYQVLSDTFPGLQPLCDGCAKNRINWQKSSSDADADADQTSVMLTESLPAPSKKRAEVPPTVRKDPATESKRPATPQKSNTQETKPSKACSML